MRDMVDSIAARPGPGMSRVLKISILVFLFASQSTIHAQLREDYYWKDISGKERTPSDLAEILFEHQQWLKSGGRSGRLARSGICKPTEGTFL